jgi:hypothetical protein
MLVQDENGNWIDDGSGDYGYDMDTLANSGYMQPQLPGQNYSTAKWNFGAPQMQGQNTFNQWVTGQKGMNTLQGDPMTAYLAMVNGGVPTMNQNSLMGLDSSGLPYQGSGGSGGGGGANGYNPNFVPSVINRLKNSAPGSYGATIWEGINSNKGAIDIKQEFHDPKYGYDTDTLHMLDTEVDNAYNELSLMERNDMAGMNQPAQQTPIQKWMDENGLINPLETYSPDNLPGDIDTTRSDQESVAAQNRYLGQADKYDQLAKTASKAIGKRALWGLDTEGVLQQGQADAARTGAEDMMGRIFGTGGAPAAAVAPNRTLFDSHQKYNEATGHWEDIPAKGAAPVGQSRKPLPMQVPPGQGNQILKKRAAEQKQAQWQAAVYQRSAESARQKAQENSGDGYRQLIANQIAKSGRTPARDAQAAIVRYMRSGGMPG